MLLMFFIDVVLPMFAFSLLALDNHHGAEVIGKALEVQQVDDK